MTALSASLAGRLVFTLTREAAASSGLYYCSFHLTDVRGRLGVVARVDELTPPKIEVWVLRDVRRDREGWCRRYSVQMDGVQQQLSLPHFAHGDYVLTNGCKGDQAVVFGHRLSGAGTLHCREVRISERKPGTAMAATLNGDLLRTFAYIETRSR